MRIKILEYLEEIWSHIIQSIQHDPNRYQPIENANFSICLRNLNFEFSKEVINNFKSHIWNLERDLPKQSQKQESDLNWRKLIVAEKSSEEGHHEEL